MDDEVMRGALAALCSGPRHSVTEALHIVPDAAGLYAVYGDQIARDLLGFPEDSALYVGKAERSLVSRDLRTHFATGKTGSSTLRRTLAALLREPLDLHAVPRNTAKPDGSANYGLAPDGDARLTEWMHNHLKLAVWVKPQGLILDDIETAALAAMTPPLNLSKMGRGSARGVKEARAAMAAEARAWRPDRLMGPEAD